MIGKKKRGALSVGKGAVNGESSLAVTLKKCPMHGEKCVFPMRSRQPVSWSIEHQRPAFTSPSFAILPETN